MFYMKAKCGNQVNFCISGDFNKVPIGDILSANGAIKQVISVPTRKSATLEVILTDLATFFHPPTSLPPLEVDQGKKGSDSDHNVVVFAPRSNNHFKKERQFTVIKHRPLPSSRIQEFGQELVPHPWLEVLECEDGHQKAANFHNSIMWFRNKYFPEKNVKISSLDKEWMNSNLKAQYTDMTKEYFKNGRTDRWKRLYVKFRKEKRRTIKELHNEDFAKKLIQGSQRNFYKQVKKVGGLKLPSGRLNIASLEGKTDQECAQAIGESYAAISQAYAPVDLTSLPAYLPAQLPPQVGELEVWEKLKNLKKTKSTFPIDLPEKLRKEFSVELTAPLVNIYNCCLRQGIFPQIWKQELVSPVPKLENLKVIKDTRKVSCLSDYCKIYESFLKTWILEDISENECFSQFGGKKGIGAEHMIVCMVDRILKLLDTTEGKAVVIGSRYDWSSAFDMQDPTKTIQKFIRMGVRPSLIPILIDFLTKRSMKIKFNGKEAGPFSLIGGSPQGSYIGQICFTTGSHDNTEEEEVDPEDKYQYIDDLKLLEIIFLADVLIEYDFQAHVASDIAIDQRFLPPANTKTQGYNDHIASWTNRNQMKLNTGKSKYIVYTRMHENFATRFTLENTLLERQSAMKLLGIWISQEPGCWEGNTREIIKCNINMLTKLKYAGVSMEKLLHIYSLFVRSRTEFCSVAWHENLTIAQQIAIERLQIVSLKVILGNKSPKTEDGHFDYQEALRFFKLKSLFQRRELRMIDFGKKCIKHPSLKRLFPLNDAILNDPHNVRSREMYHVNHARTSVYQKSAIPSIQRRLNKL